MFLSLSLSFLTFRWSSTLLSPSQARPYFFECPAPYWSNAIKRWYQKWSSDDREEDLSKLHKTIGWFMKNNGEKQWKERGGEMVEKQRKKCTDTIYLYNTRLDQLPCPRTLPLPPLSLLEVSLLAKNSIPPRQVAVFSFLQPLHDERTRLCVCVCVCVCVCACVCARVC